MNRTGTLKKNSWSDVQVLLDKQVEPFFFGARTGIGTFKNKSWSNVQVL